MILAEAAFQSIYQAACSSHFKADEAIINSEPKKKKKKFFERCIQSSLINKRRLWKRRKVISASFGFSLLFIL